MNPHLTNFVAQLKDHALDAYLVTQDANIRYLTGFPSSESWLLVTAKEVFYLTDFRYIEEARQALKGVKVYRYSRTLAEGVFELTNSRKIRKLGFDEQHLSLSAFKKLKSQCPAALKFIAVNNLVEHLREIKDAREVAAIRKALKLHQAAHFYLRKVIRPGLSEREVLLKLEYFVKSRGALFSFDPIIASGPNSCFPHAKVSGRKIRPNEPLLIDLGIDLNGYKSDLTRIFFLGKIPRLVREVTTAVEIAQKKAIEKIKAGVKAAFIDYQARNYLENKKLGKFFGHSLGHGVGLEIHEAPRLSPRSPSILRKNMVVTVEPAVYLPGKFGIRIEDMILVHDNRGEVLSGDIDHGY